MRALVIVLSLGLVGASDAQEWKPAPTPLSTRWAADVNPGSVLPEYPRPQLTREKWLNLNGLWQFAPIAVDGEEPPFKKDLPRSILVPFPIESSLSGIGESHERAWYRRTFTLPDDWCGHRIILHFGAVDWETDIYVNGIYLRSHKGGYDAFEVDISPALLSNAPRSVQELIVGLYDPPASPPPPRRTPAREPAAP